jgi:hypothetical protein
MADMGIVYVVGASAALAAVVAFLAFLALGHEKLKTGEPEKAKSQYRRVALVGFSIAGGGGLVTLVGLILSQTTLSWFGVAILDAGVLATAYAAFGYLDIKALPARQAQPGKADVGGIEKLLGTAVVVAGLVTFLSWGLDFIAFPALGVTAVLVVAWLVVRVRSATPRRRR